jgi:DNA mismatch repair protein MutS2
LRATGRGSLDAIESRLREDVIDGGAAPAATVAVAQTPAETEHRRPEPGDRVVVGPLGIEGVVHAVFGRDAEVEVRGKRLRAATDQLRLLGRAAKTEATQVRVNVQTVARDAVHGELNVIGCTVDEALGRADKFLDEAIVAELRSVRLVHGHGTGQLRRGLAAYLHEHPMVARFGAAPSDQGGNAVTVVEFKE